MPLDLQLLHPERAHSGTREIGSGEARCNLGSRANQHEADPRQRALLGGRRGGLPGAGLGRRQDRRRGRPKAG